MLLPLVRPWPTGAAFLPYHRQSGLRGSRVEMSALPTKHSRDPVLRFSILPLTIVGS